MRQLLNLEWRFDGASIFRSGLDLKHLNNNLRIYEHKLWKPLLNFNPIVTPFEIEHRWVSNKDWVIKIKEIYFETDHQKQTFVDFFKLEESGDGSYILNEKEGYYLRIWSFENNEPTWSLKNITNIKCKNNLSLRVYSPIKTYNESLKWREDWFKLKNGK